MTLTLVSISLVLVYVGGYVITMHSFPDSISAMVYDFPQGWQWLWTVWLWLVSFTIAPPLLEVIKPPFQFVGFLTVACLLFVASMPLVRHERNTLHYVFAIAAGILSQVCVLVIKPIALSAWVALPLFLWVFGKEFFKEAVVLVSEVVCVATLYGVIILSLK